MALLFCSHNQHVLSLPEPPINGNAPSIANLIQYAKKEGLTLAAYRIVDFSVVGKSIELPILTVMKEDGLTHMVFLYKRKKHGFLALDPNLGERLVTDEEFYKIFSGVYLEIQGFEEKGGRPSSRHSVSTKTTTLLSLSALLPASLLIAGALLLEYTPFPILAWALVLLSCLSQCIPSIIAQRHSRKFDQEYLWKVDAKNPKRRRENYIHYHRYKRAALMSFPLLFGHLFQLSAALVFFAIHDLALGLVLAIALAISIVDYLVETPILNRKKHEAEHNEAKYFDGLMEEGERKALLGALSLNAKDFGIHLSLRQGILFLTSALLSFLAGLLGGDMTVTHLLFVFFACLFLFSESEKSYRYAELIEEKRKEEGYFQLHFMDNA